MTREEFIARFPQAGPSTIRRNYPVATPVGDQAPAAVVERDIQTPLAPAEVPQRRGPKKCLVRIESRRIQLQDPDNSVEKWHVDALRYAGLIPNDTADDIEIRKSQTKVHSKEEECTVITLTDVEELSTDRVG